MRFVRATCATGFAWCADGSRRFLRALRSHGGAPRLPAPVRDARRGARAPVVEVPHTHAEVCVCVSDLGVRAVRGPRGRDDNDGARPKLRGLLQGAGSFLVGRWWASVSRTRSCASVCRAAAMGRCDLFRRVFRVPAAGARSAADGRQLGRAVARVCLRCCGVGQGGGSRVLCLLLPCQDPARALREAVCAGVRRRALIRPMRFQPVASL